jgi:hypothetical protein
MDTSGKNLGQAQSATRPENYTKEELASILKFGAANINILAYSRIIFFRARSRTSSSTVSLVTKR